MNKNKRLLIIESEGYGSLNDIFPTYGHNYYLIDKDDAEKITEKFNKFVSNLGDCPDAIEKREHKLSDHVYIVDIVTLHELPNFLKGDN